MARLTGLEPATPGVTGRYSNQLSYNRPLRFDRLRLTQWHVKHQLMQKCEFRAACRNNFA